MTHLKEGCATLYCADYMSSESAIFLDITVDNAKFNGDSTFDYLTSTGITADTLTVVTANVNDLIATATVKALSITDGTINITGGIVTGVTNLTTNALTVDTGGVTPGHVLTAVDASGLCVWQVNQNGNISFNGAPAPALTEIALFDNVNGMVIGAGSGVLVSATGDITDVNHLTAAGAIQGGSLTDGIATLSGGALTSAIMVTASGAIQGGSLTDGTATLSVGALSGVNNINCNNIYNGFSINTGILTATGTVQGSSLTDGTVATLTGGALSGVNSISTGSLTAITTVQGHTLAASPGTTAVPSINFGTANTGLSGNGSTEIRGSVAGIQQISITNSSKPLQVRAGTSVSFFPISTLLAANAIGFVASFGTFHIPITIPGNSVGTNDQLRLKLWGHADTINGGSGSIVYSISGPSSSFPAFNFNNPLLAGTSFTTEYIMKTTKCTGTQVVGGDIGVATIQSYFSNAMNSIVSATDITLTISLITPPSTPTCLIIVEGVTLELLPG